MANLVVRDATVTGTKLQSNFLVTCGQITPSSINKPEKLYSDEYLIKDTLFQVKVFISYSKHLYNGNWNCSFNSLIFIKFMKTKAGKNYVSEFCSKALQISEKYISADDDGDYRLIGETHLREFEMDIEIKIELVEPINHFAKLYDDNELTDFELRGADGSIRIHKVVLAAFSPVLNKMLRGKWKEVTEGYMVLRGVSQMTLQNLKNYMYCDILPTEGLEPLLLLASQYMMNLLEHRCLNEIRMSITAENAFGLLEFAVKNNIRQLTLFILKLLQNKSISVDDMMNETKKLTLETENDDDLESRDAN